ncbi:MULTISPECIES: hypothetical protein [Tsukamurella]|uniref:Uncharacterized protein n=1 Tax=Tsukamurella strandjordii TaxID=147577 RepID=A0AA90SHB1_9ACTN|nr:MULTISPECIES: hypothetical protein [Tsukamurella]MDP0398634.1 hypothetical protein [Tsukamurella strandjordii]GIZ99575.1 hypothetical protein TTY48_41870 [Tsukamurella sp. TY48]
MGSDQYGIAAFVVDALAAAYLMPLFAWLGVARADSKLYSPLQAIQRVGRRGFVGLGCCALGLGVVIGRITVPLAGVAIVVGGAVGIGLVVLSQRLPGASYSEPTGWRAVWRFTLVVGMVIVALVGWIAFAAASEAAGGAFGDPKNW